LFSPEIRQDPAAPVTVQVLPPGLAVTVNDVGAGGAPAATVTVTEPLCGTPVGAGGVFGADAEGVTGVEASEGSEVPEPLVAVAVNVYAMALARPGTKQDVAGAVIVQVAPSGLAVTVYVLPTGVPGGTVTVAPLLPATPVGIPGLPGMAANGVVAGLDAGDGAEVPSALVAVAVNVYGEPLDNPVTTQDPADPVTVQVLPPGLAVTVNDVGTGPAPAATVTVAAPLRGTAVGAGGTPGPETGVTGSDSTDSGEVPPSLLAVDLNVYAVPLVRPVTTHDPEAPMTVQVLPGAATPPTYAWTV